MTFCDNSQDLCRALFRLLMFQSCVDMFVCLFVCFVLFCLFVCLFVPVWFNSKPRYIEPKRYPKQCQPKTLRSSNQTVPTSNKSCASPLPHSAIVREKRVGSIISSNVLVIIFGYYLCSIWRRSRECRSTASKLNAQAQTLIEPEKNVKELTAAWNADALMFRYQRQKEFLGLSS